MSIGKELDRYTPKGIDGLNLVLECTSNVNNVDESTPFQFFLGRLLALELILDRYRLFFTLSNIITGNSEKRFNTRRIKRTIDFLKKAFYFNHLKVATLAKKLLFHITKIQEGIGIKWILSRFEANEVQIKEYLRKKLSNPRCFEQMKEIEIRIQKHIPVKRIYNVASNTSELTTFTSSRSQTNFSSLVNSAQSEDERPLTAPETLCKKDESQPHMNCMIKSSVCQCSSNIECSPEAKSIHLSETLSNQENFNFSETILSENFTEKFPTERSIYLPQILKISHEDDTKYHQSDRAIQERQKFHRPESRLGFINEDLTSELKKRLSDSNISNCLISDFLEESNEDEFSDLDERDVFTIEIATSPRRDIEECKCKEEVEIEEDKALVEALLRSEQQTQLPNVPGLKCLLKDSHVTDQSEIDNVEPYIENTHWVKGPSIGTGGFCTCYLARDKRTGTLMACKQICLVRNKQEDEEKEIEKIETEIRLLGNLSHPNVLRLLGATRHGSHFFMFTEWMPGGSVASLLDIYGSFTEPVTVNYVRQVILGLSYLHEKRILHRDLKG